MPGTETTVVKEPVTIQLGCDPEVNVTLTETPTGTVFVSIAAADPTKPALDFDGFFFNLTDDSALDDLGFFPDPNTGSIFSPVTGLETNANSANTLANGAQVKEGYDIGVQFGRVDSSTEGEVAQVNFTLFTNSGPLLLDDIDLDSLIAVVDSDGGNGQVLTTKDAAGDDPILVDTVALFEDFDDIHAPTQSDIIESSDGWTVAYNQLYTNSHNEGTVTLEEVSTDGPVSLTMDLNTHDTHVFENSGYAEDSLRIEVSIDGGAWVLLDEYQVNDHKTALVGSETGQSFGVGGNTVTYSGGILDTAEDSAQFRIISDLTASNEVIKIDNLTVNASVLTDPDAVPVEVQSEAFSEDFSGLYHLTNSDNIDRSDGWNASHGGAFTNGHNDGMLKFDRVDTEGPASISFDAVVNNTHNFEAGGHFGDSLELQVRLDDGSWQTLDTFVVNHDKTALVGSETGNEITEHNTTLSYEGGILDTPSDSVQFRFISDISASNEQILIDNVTVETTELVAAPNGDEVKIDFDALAAGDVVDGQFNGVTISAQRAGDSDGSENDAMIFDSDHPTGGDHDLEYDGRGNILIISEDNDSHDPDDNWQGGTITFDFDAPSDVVSLTVLDIEEHGGTIDLLDSDGGVIRSINIPTTGNNGAQDVSIDTDGVSTMNVNFAGSGAVDDLCYIPPSDDAECDAQYDVHYVGGVPMLPVVEEEMVEETSDDLEEDLMI